jgi:hypothetical protein
MRPFAEAIAGFIVRPCVSSLLLVVGVFGVLANAPSTARGQVLDWEMRAGSGPSPRYGHAMAYDSARDVTVLFGGWVTGAYSAEAWEWSASNGEGAWTLRATSGPGSSYGHAMAYDAARGVTVLFGGFNATSRHGETWEWNGTLWALRPVIGPSPRSGASLVYDAARCVVVLFGGHNNNLFHTDTWEWNGTVWTLRALSGPPARGYQGMVYDTNRNATVLFGGHYGGVRYADTWEWYGTGEGVWTQRMLDGPSARTYPKMVYDSPRGVTVLFGGENSGVRYADTWMRAGSGAGMWVHLPVDGPSSRTGHALAFDSRRGVAVLFGGFTTALNAETWEFRITGSCAADLDNDGIFANGGFPDDAVTIEDLLYFLIGFEGGSNLVDLDNGTYTGTRDEAVDFYDLLFFLDRFEAGC